MRKQRAQAPTQEQFDRIRALFSDKFSELDG